MYYWHKNHTFHPNFHVKTQRELILRLSTWLTISVCIREIPVMPQREIIKKLSVLIKRVDILTKIPDSIICGINTIGIIPITFSADDDNAEIARPKRVETIVIPNIQKIILIGLVKGK